MNTDTLEIKKFKDEELADLGPEWVRLSEDTAKGAIKLNRKRKRYMAKLLRSGVNEKEAYFKASNEEVGDGG